MHIKHIIWIFFLALISVSCGIYSFTGASVPKNVKTYQVNYFENRALLVEPGLDRDFKIALEDLIQNQTNLTLSLIHI